MIKGCKAKMSPRLKLRLYVEAIGGVLEGVCRAESDGVTVRLTTGDGYRGEISHGAREDRRSQVHVHFWSDEQAVRMFAERWFVPPLVMSGWLRLGRLAGFAQGMRQLGEQLQDRESQDPEVLRRQFEVGLRAAVPVVEEDEEGQMLLRSCPEGLIRFRVGSATLGPGLRVEGGRLQLDETGERDEVTVCFGSVEVLRDALKGRLDSLAALGSGALRVDGLIPLADGMDLVLVRAGECLRSLGAD